MTADSNDRHLAPVPAMMVWPANGTGTAAVLTPLTLLEDSEGGRGAWRGDLEIVEYLRHVRRHKWLVAGVSVFMLLAALAFDLSRMPLYRVRTALDMQADRGIFRIDGAGEAAQVPGGLEPKVRLVESRRIRNAVVEKLRAQASQYKPDQTPGSWLTRVARRMHLDPRPASLSVDRMITMTAASISARAVGEILEIACESPDPKLAAATANFAAAEFIEETVNIRGDSTLRANRLLAEQVDDLKRNLEKAERNLQTYAQESGLLFTSETDTVAEDRLRGLQRELLTAHADRANKQVQYDMIRTVPPDIVHTVVNDSVIEGYDVRLTELKRQLAELTTSLTPEHYKVRDLQAQIAVSEAALSRKKAEIVARYQNEYEAAARRERELLSAFSAQTGVVSDQARKGVSYGILKREVDANRHLYQAMLQRVKELEISAAMRASNIRIIDPAIPGSVPFQPNPVKSGTLGLATGLLLSLTLVFIRQRVDQAVRAPGEGPAYLKVPELGVIPAARASIVMGVSSGRPVTPFSLLEAGRSGDADCSPELATWHRGVSMFAESFRSTITSLLLAQSGKGLRTVVVTSPGASDGKSTVVSNLAIALVETSKRVLIMDGDVRNPRMHNIFNVANTAGLTDLIQQPTPLTPPAVESLTQRTDIPNLSLLPSGPPVRSISGLLFSRKIEELFLCCQELYDIVMIDSPPILQFADARILGRNSDGVILVVRSGTGRMDAIAARARLAEDGINVLGTILNDWDPTTYNGSHYSRYYTYYADLNRTGRYAGTTA